MTGSSADQTGITTADLPDLLRAHGARLGEAHRRRLDWLVRNFGPPVVRENGNSTQASGVVIVLDPPSGAGAELLYGSLEATLRS